MLAPRGSQCGTVQRIATFLQRRCEMCAYVCQSLWKGDPFPDFSHGPIYKVKARPSARIRRSEELSGLVFPLLWMYRFHIACRLQHVAVQGTVMLKPCGCGQDRDKKRQELDTITDAACSAASLREGGSEELGLIYTSSPCIILPI